MSSDKKKHDQKPKDKDAERQPAQDEVEEASQESFPASDAPGWTQSTTQKPNPKKDHNK